MTDHDRRWRLPLLTLLAAALALTGCGSDDSGGDKPTNSPSTGGSAVTSAPATTTASGAASSAQSSPAQSSSSQSSAPASLAAFCTDVKAIVDSLGVLGSGTVKTVPQAKQGLQALVPRAKKLAGEAPSEIKSSAQDLSTGLQAFVGNIARLRSVAEISNPSDPDLMKAGEQISRGASQMVPWAVKHCPN